jgi:hypothetical protein
MEGLPGLPAIRVRAGLPHFPPQLVASVKLARKKRAQIRILARYPPQTRLLFPLGKERRLYARQSVSVLYESNNGILSSFKGKTPMANGQGALLPFILP